MSPASLRRYRAERLLREQFRSLRASVVASTRGRLRACGAELDESDLEACYAQAWQGLYAAMLEGQHIANPAGWLAVVTFRRAIDEHRARARAGLRERGGERPSGEPLGAVAHAGFGCAAARDPALEIDERTRLRHLLEALRLQLSEREQQAAALCYLQGLSRAQAARTMGVSDTRMRKLMEGTGRGRPGVAAKMTALVETIRDGGWCEEQGSLMRGLAYGVLDPRGERHRLALMHTDGCPACRAYVASLRGLAALLPPAPSLLPLLLAGGAGAKLAGAGAASGSTTGVSRLGEIAAEAGSKAASAASQRGATGGGLSAPGAVSSGAAASGAAGAGAAGGGWLLAGGGVGAKLAAGCLIALGVGAGCAVLGAGRLAGGSPARAHARVHIHRASHVPLPPVPAAVQHSGAATPAPARVAVTPSRAASASASGPAARASREFGLEQRVLSAGAERAGQSRARPEAAPVAAARAASAGAEFARAEAPSAPSSAAQARPSSTRASSASAQREFSPG
jgi:DNA-directed RNA polymerase specialized sigma24 family protein